MKKILLILFFLNPVLIMAIIPTNVNVIFVAGYHNEKIDGYFEEHIKQLESDYNIKARKITPYSETSVSNNADSLAKFLSNHNGKLLIVAHSKGGLEVLNAYLRNPHLIKNTHKIVLVQAPLKGSVYADYYWDKTDHSNWYNPSYFFYTRYKYAGFLSMRTKIVNKDILKSASYSTNNELRALSKILYYWRSKKEDPKAAYDEYKPALVSYIDHDGLVPSTNMKLSNLNGTFPFGTDLGIDPDTDHLELVSPGKKVTSQYVRKVRTFLTEILRGL